MTRHSTALFFLLLVSARADTLTLCNGITVTGSYVSIDAKEVGFRVGDEMKKYPGPMLRS